MTELQRRAVEELGRAWKPVVEAIAAEARAAALEEAAHLAETEGDRVLALSEDHDEARRIAAAIRARISRPPGEEP